MKSRIDGVGIKAISVAVPSRVIKLVEYIDYKSQTDLKRAFLKTGVESLRYAKEATTTSDLCEQASLKLFDAGYSKNDIGAIVFGSKTPDYIMPSTSCCLQGKMGLSKDVLCYDYNGGCCGYLYGLQLSSMLAKLHNTNVLLLTGDTNSKLVSRRDFTSVSLFGDGGSATIVGPEENNHLSFHIKNDGTRYDTIIVPAGAFRNPRTEENSRETERENGNYRSDCNTEMKGATTMNFILNEAVDLLSDTIEKSDKPIDWYFFHQANKFIIKSLIACLKLPEDKVPIVVNGYGNTSSCTIPLAICGSDFTNHKNENNNFSMLAAFGVGLSWGTILTDLSNSDILPVAEVDL